MTAALLLCSDPLYPRPAGRVDPHFAPVAGAARELGAAVGLIDHDALAAGDAEAAVRRVREGLGPAWYRGWMVSSAQYTELDRALSARGCTLLTTPGAYRTAHEFPGWYETFGKLTPAGQVLPDPAQGPLDDRLDAAVALLGARTVIVKDYVKSRKHEPDAFLVRDTTDTTDAAELHTVVANFVERQGADLAGGLVLRAFEDFVPASEGGGEARVWWLDGEAVAVTAHPDTPGVLPEPDLSGVAEAVGLLPARFVTTDLARRTDGTWRVIEVGDGQVSDFPKDTAIEPLISALTEAG